MKPRQAGATHGVKRPGTASAPSPQMEASHSESSEALEHAMPKPPVPAAFGSGGGAALVFRDYASI